jgi:hypothetical protein
MIGPSVADIADLGVATDSALIAAFAAFAASNSLSMLTM